jgi:hypothetical protein
VANPMLEIPFKDEVLNKEFRWIMAMGALKFNNTLEQKE